MPHHKHTPGRSSAKIRKFFSSRGFKLGLLAVVAATMVTIGALVYTGNLSVGNVNLTPSTFQPTQVSSRVFDVSSGAGGVGPLGTGLTYSYLDPDHRYPGVSIFQSDPYFSDHKGNPINLTADNILLTGQQLVVGDTVYYLHQYYQTIQVGARTRWNTPEIGDTTSYVSPFTGLVWDNRLYRLPGTPGGNTVFTQGDLVMYDMHNSWNEWQNPSGIAIVSASKGVISSSLVPIYFPNIQSQAPAGCYTPSGASDYIKNNFGNREVHVYPKITITGLSNYISYSGFSYNVTLPNGTVTTTTINTQGSYVGFVEARKTGLDICDVVPAANPVGVNPNTYMAVGESTQTTSAKESPDAGDKESSVTGYLLTGYIHPKPTEGYPETSQYMANVQGYSTSLDTQSIQIVIDDTSNNCGMAQDIVITPELRLRPATKIYWTKASVKWDSLLRLTVPIIGSVISDDRTHSGTADNIYWPYACDVTNVFAIAQFTMKICIVTQNQISMVTSAGAPINVAQAITDFGSGAIVKNPNTDLTDIDLAIPPVPDLWSWLSSLFPNFWGNVTTVLIWIGVIAGAIGAILLVLWMRKIGLIGGRKSSSPTQAPVVV